MQSPRTRWFILAMLFLATTINYLDRIVFSVLSPVIREELHFSNQEYGYLTAAFQAAYTIGFLFSGRLIDGLGTKAGYAISIVVWSIAAALHVLSKSVFGLGFWRAMLGLGESGNFPAAIKSVAEWFPKKDRAFATGIFNAGTNVASMVGPPLFVAMNLAYGWRFCFLITAALGLLWVAFWWFTYRNPPGEEELGERREPKVGWAESLRYRETWGFASAKFFTDGVWWFYLFWLPPYLYDARGFEMTQIGWALPFIYLMADIGSVGGGWISGALMRRGWQPYQARRFSMALFAFSMPIAATAVAAPSPILAIALVSLATSSHQGWSANLFTTVSDAFPRGAVASVTGIGGCMGGLGGFIFSAMLPGYIVENFGYEPMFVLMGTLHVIAWFSMQLLVWREQAKQAHPVAAD